MRILDLFTQSLRAITTHKRRNAFSTFGIAWGVAAVLILAGWGVGLEKFMNSDGFGRIHGRGKGTAQVVTVFFQGFPDQSIGVQVH